MKFRFGSYCRVSSINYSLTVEYKSPNLVLKRKSENIAQ